MHSPRDYHQGPFVNGRSRKPQGPFVQPRVRSFRLSKLFTIGIVLAIIAWVVSIGFDPVKSAIDEQREDVQIPSVQVDVPNLADTPDASEDPNNPGTSQIVTVLRVGPSTVRVRTMLGRELTWGLACPAVRRVLVGQVDKRPILSWERAANGAVRVVRVMGTGSIVTCTAAQG